jgi:hypothetical protein
MPQKSSHIITIGEAGGKMNSPYLLRTHRIAIYPEETQKILAFIKTKNL